jgi:hypothetical protein
MNWVSMTWPNWNARKESGTGDTLGSSSAAVDLPARQLVIALAVFSAVSAMAGATELLVWRMGNRYLPLALLDHTPFTNFTIPGLLLGMVVGGSSVACATLTWRKSPAAVDATILAGGALAVWIVAEVAMMRTFHALHGVYGVLGTALLGLGAHAAWRFRAPRHRWLIVVTLAETMGFLVPASAGVLSTKAGIGGTSQAALLVASGFVEGLALGAGQSWAFPLPVRRIRYTLLTTAAAGIVWSSVMLLTSVGGAAPVAILVLAALATALVGLAAIGSSQWIELRHHVERAHRWILWTALAWVAALPLSFAPGPLVDELTPVSSQVVLWGCGGLLMAYVMALITWQGVRRIQNELRVRS